MDREDPSENESAAVDDLIGRLADGARGERGRVRYAGNPHDRRRAISALAKIGPPVVGRLISSLDLDLGVGTGAAEVLGLIGDEQALLPLMVALADEKRSDLRRSAATALGRIGYREATFWLLAALLDDDEDVRWAVAHALGDSGYPDALEELAACVRRRPGKLIWKTDEDGRLWVGPLSARRLLDDYEAVEQASTELARLAAYALGRIGEPQGVAPLLQALKDRNEDVRWQAAEALGEIGLPEALPELERAVREDDDLSDQGRISDAAREAIAKIRARGRPQPPPLPERPPGSVLYKYFPPKLLCVLENRSLRFTPASCFNDPFELFTTMDAFIRPVMTALESKRLKVMRTSQVLAVKDEHLGDLAHDLGLPGLHEARLRRDDSDIVRSIRQAVEHAVAAERKGSSEARNAVAEAREHLDRRFGVLCLTERPDDILMWSHYAEHHRGFVLEFDATNPFFDRRRHDHDPIRRIRQVKYHEAHPPRGLFDQKYWYRSQSSAARDFLEYSAGLFLLTKSRDWAHEREWRMILPLAEADQIVPPKEGENGDVHLFRFPPECLRAVVLGCRMTTKDRECLRQVLQHSEYSHVIPRNAEMHTHRFCVLVKDDDSVVERSLLADLAAFPSDGIQQRLDRLKVGGRRFYAAVSSLAEKGWLAAPPHEPSLRGKRILKLTEAGRNKYQGIVEGTA